MTTTVSRKLAAAAASCLTMILVFSAPAPAHATTFSPVDQNVDCGWRGVVPKKYKNCSTSKRHVYQWIGLLEASNRYCIKVPPKETVTLSIFAISWEGPYSGYC